MDLERKLEELERELAARLRDDLARVAAGRDTVYFFNTDHNPFDLPESRLSTHGTQAYELARDIRNLRAQLELTDDGPAAMFLEAVRRHADQSDPHRLGPKRLAEQLVTALEAKPTDRAG